MTTDVHPVRLKIDLATRGARLDGWLAGPLIDVPDYTRRTVDLVLPDGVRVAVPIGDGVDTGAYAVVGERGRAFVTDSASLRLEVEAGVIPAFYARSTTSGRPMWQVATVASNRLLVTPTGTCGFSTRGAPCSFCREGARPAGERERAASIADVVEVVRAAFDEGVAQFVFLNTSVYDAEDGGIDFLTPYIEAVRKHFDTFVAVQVHPPRSNHWIDRTYAMGVDALSYNLEVFDPEILGRHCIGRVRYVGRERYLEALAYAASIFPGGTVWTDLMLGIEPADSTVAGIDLLAGMGVVPVLAVHHLGPDTIPQLTLDEAVDVVAHLDRTARARKLNLTWVPEVAFGVTPVDAYRLTGQGPYGGSGVQSLVRWRLGAYAARGIARVRRRLRVRAISDSLDSSHL